MRPHLPLFIIFLYAKSSHFNRNPHDLADFATASSGENFTKLPLMWLHPKTGCRGKLDLLLRNLFMLVYTDHAYHNPESIFTQSFHLSFFLLPSLPRTWHTALISAAMTTAGHFSSSPCVQNTNWGITLLCHTFSNSFAQHSWVDGSGVIRGHRVLCLQTQHHRQDIKDSYGDVWDTASRGVLLIVIFK